MSGMDRLTDEALAVLEKWQSAMDDEILKGLQKATHADSVDTDRVVLEVTYADVQTLLAHRRASQAATAPSDLLREAWIAGRDAAKKVAGTFCWSRCVEGGKLKSPAVFTTHTWQRIQEAIDAECPVPDDLSASPAQEGGE